MDAAQRSAQRAQAAAQKPFVSPLLASAMRGGPAAGGAVPSATPMQRLGQVFRQPITSPAQQGMLTAAATGLQLAGPQPVPTSTGQILGQMGMAGLQAFTKAKEAEAAQRAAAFDRQYKAEMLGLKAQEVAAKGGGMFKGSGFKAGAFNMLISLAPKIKNKTATAQEEQAYSLAYGEAAAPRTIKSYDDQGNETIETIPGANMSQFPKPSGYVEPEVTTKPSTEAVKTSKFAAELRTMGSRLNQYRNLLMADTFDRADMVSGASGFPTDEMAQASSVAEALRLDLKNLYELGALVGGDFQILDNLLTAPNTSKAARAGKTSLLLQLDQLERTIQDKLKEKEQPSIPGLYLNPIEITTRDEWDEVPIGGYAILPNGEIVYKER
tara:strand:+ start:897 stop:2042 length:1146 start_codon:yes stop_codon:yes gene_type:complete